MQIVIDISDSLYDILLDMNIDSDTCSFNESALVESIQNGTPIPKGHGDLIDRKELLENKYEIDSMYCEYDEVVNVDDIKDAPTIIEADKEESEE